MTKQEFSEETQRAKDQILCLVKRNHDSGHSTGEDTISHFKIVFHDDAIETALSDLLKTRMIQEVKGENYNSYALHENHEFRNGGGKDEQQEEGTVLIQQLKYHQHRTSLLLHIADGGVTSWNTKNFVPFWVNPHKIIRQLVREGIVIYTLEHYTEQMQDMIIKHYSLNPDWSISL